MYIVCICVIFFWRCYKFFFSPLGFLVVIILLSTILHRTLRNEFICCCWWCSCFGAFNSGHNGLMWIKCIGFLMLNEKKPPQENEDGYSQQDVTLCYADSFNFHSFCSSFVALFIVRFVFSYLFSRMPAWKAIKLSSTDCFIYNFTNWHYSSAFDSFVSHSLALCALRVNEPTNTMAVSLLRQ